jgi:Putative DNA-binding domain
LAVQKQYFAFKTFKEMQMSRLPHLDIADLPSSEDERLEFKSSRVSMKELKGKLGCAASGFWNAGGGVFVAGVDGNGKPDGGIDDAIGRQTLRDWVDQVIQEVSPSGNYAVRIFPCDPTTALNGGVGKCVLAVEFHESNNAPHMAPDQKYYIRAGAHTVPASHYIVEALWTRRRHQRPQLVHTLRVKPEDSDVVQLAILALTDEPAMNVRISLDPLPEMWKNANTSFPLTLPVLDRTTPFYLDVTTFVLAEERLGQVQVRVDYEDRAMNRYDYTGALAIESLAPWRIGTPATEQIAKSLESIEKTIKEIPKSLDNLHAENVELRSQFELWRNASRSSGAPEASAIAAGLSTEARRLLYSAKEDGRIVFSPYLGSSMLHAGQTQLIEDQRSIREVVRWKQVISELRRHEAVEGVFQHGKSSVFQLTHFGYEVAAAIQLPGDPTAAGRVHEMHRVNVE